MIFTYKRGTNINTWQENQKGVKPSGDWSRICRRDNVISVLHLGPSRGFSICKTLLHDSRYTTNHSPHCCFPTFNWIYTVYILYHTGLRYWDSHWLPKARLSIQGLRVRRALNRGYLLNRCHGLGDQDRILEACPLPVLVPASPRNFLESMSPTIWKPRSRAMAAANSSRPLTSLHGPSSTNKRSRQYYRNSSATLRQAHSN